MNIIIPKKSLILLVGPSGSGKSTFAKVHFRPTEILSSDFFRAMISDDENDQTVTVECFEILHLIAEYRLKKNRLTVIDATNIQPQSREPFLKLAQKYQYPAVAIIFNLPCEKCIEWNKSRPNRLVEPTVVEKQYVQLQETLKYIKNEPFLSIYFLSNPMQIEDAQVKLIPY